MKTQNHLRNQKLPSTPSSTSSSTSCSTLSSSSNSIKSNSISHHSLKKTSTTENHSSENSSAHTLFSKNNNKTQTSKSQSQIPANLFKKTHVIKLVDKSTKKIPDNCYPISINVSDDQNSKNIQLQESASKGLFNQKISSPKRIYYTASRLSPKSLKKHSSSNPTTVPSSQKNSPKKFHKISPIRSKVNKGKVKGKGKFNTDPGTIATSLTYDNSTFHPPKKRNWSVPTSSLYDSKTLIAKNLINIASLPESITKSNTKSNNNNKNDNPINSFSSSFSNSESSLNDSLSNQHKNINGSSKKNDKSTIYQIPSSLSSIPSHLIPSVSDFSKPDTISSTSSSNKRYLIPKSNLSDISGQYRGLHRKMQGYGRMLNYTDHSQNFKVSEGCNALPKYSKQNSASTHSLVSNASAESNSQLKKHQNLNINDNNLLINLFNNSLSENNTNFLEQDNIVELDILVQNERGWTFFGTPYYASNLLFSFLDPDPWTTLDNKFTPFDIYNAQLPNTDWEWTWDRWYVDMSGSVDDQGWQYAFSFFSKNWHGSHKLFCSNVRRRRWIRKRIFKPLASKLFKMEKNFLESEDQLMLQGSDNVFSNSMLNNNNNNSTNNNNLSTLLIKNNDFKNDKFMHAIAAGGNDGSSYNTSTQSIFKDFKPVAFSDSKPGSASTTFKNGSPSRLTSTPIPKANNSISPFSENGNNNIPGIIDFNLNALKEFDSSKGDISSSSKKFMNNKDAGSFNYENGDKQNFSTIKDRNIQSRENIITRTELLMAMQSEQEHGNRNHVSFKYISDILPIHQDAIDYDVNNQNRLINNKSSSNIFVGSDDQCSLIRFDPNGNAIIKVDKLSKMFNCLRVSILDREKIWGVIKFLEVAEISEIEKLDSFQSLSKVFDGFLFQKTRRTLLNALTEIRDYYFERNKETLRESKEKITKINNDDNKNDLTLSRSISPLTKIPIKESSAMGINSARGKELIDDIIKISKEIVSKTDFYSDKIENEKKKI